MNELEQVKQILDKMHMGFSFKDENEADKFYKQAVIIKNLIGDFVYRLEQKGVL